MTTLREITEYTDALLQVAQFRDYCPNGLQVEGRPQVDTLISGVTASQALLDAALAAGADAILVHHGYFWKGEDPCVTGMKRRRLQTLLCAGVSLLAYHLPLDAHPELGNNACLAKRLGLRVDGTFGGNGRPDIAMYGHLPTAMPAGQFAGHVEQALGRAPTHVAGSDRDVERVAWCSGAAQSYIEQAAGFGVDAFLSGEISEQTVHVARELGLHYYAAGHHATERDGAAALGEHLAARFGLKHHFIDIDNPV
jgi:dinuclear metal center YbgI/SA1388 family protein